MQAGDEVEGSHSECADSERWNLMVLSQPVHLTRGGRRRVRYTAAVRLWLWLWQALRIMLVDSGWMNCKVKKEKRYLCLCWKKIKYLQLEVLSGYMDLLNCIRIYGFVMSLICVVCGLSTLTCATLPSPSPPPFVI